MHDGLTDFLNFILGAEKENFDTSMQKRLLAWRKSSDAECL